MLIELKKQMDLIYIFQKKIQICTRIHLLRVANKPTFSKIKSLGADILGLGIFDWVLIDWANVLSQTYV